MEVKTLKVLEFQKIKEQLMNYATSSLGKEKIENLFPSTSFEEVIQWQEETDEARKALRLNGNVPLGGIFNITAHIKRAEIGGTLGVTDLVEVASTIYASRQMKHFILEMSENESFPILKKLEEKMNPPHHLEKAIKNAINEHGEVLDSASEKLRSIRIKIRTYEARVREKLESMIRSSSAQKMLSDAIITIRNDRFVIPVKQEYRAHYGGVVHDQSSSGQTLFIEPQVIVQLNNELQSAKVEEQKEIEKILNELSEKVAENHEDLKQLVYALKELDFIFAKAKYGNAMKATKPIMNNNGYIHFKNARHPLISAEEVVPNSIELGKEYTTIVITGPNTGGKTVALKTVGLLTLMAQAGLAIPANEDSEAAVFDAVFADIGDEQSIEQSLSTFSSHMVNIVDILKKVTNNSLVLFDELGAGTDPQEGAALAISILDEVYRIGARIIATTHYPELKAYGYNRKGVVNASVEFDVETLSPTYRLLIGVPGRSNAFEISKRLGLSESIIQVAREQISTESNKVENMIASLEESRKLAEKEREEAEKYLLEAKELHEQLQREMDKYLATREQALEEARKEATEIIKNAEKEAESIIKELREMMLKRGAQIKEHELIEAKKRLQNAIPESEEPKKLRKTQVSSRKLQPGDEVKVISLGQKGNLLEKVDQNQWIVQIGIMKMKVDADDLQLMNSPKPVETKPIATIKGSDYHVPLELDLRGERLEDAILKVEKYIDDALLAGYPRVSIIHGKGTGALRKGIQEYLKNHRSIKNIRFGEAGEGGSGVTIVSFK